MVTGFYKTTNCTPQGLEIDAPTNTALLGCGTTQGQVIVGEISLLNGGSLSDVLCAARGTKAIGFVTIQNLIFVGGTQYPADPADANTGLSRVQVLYDPAAPGQILKNNTSATLAPMGAGDQQESGLDALDELQYPRRCFRERSFAKNSAC